MSQKRTCPKCAALHSGDALDGLCPSCVLGAVMASVGNEQLRTGSPPGFALPEVGGVRFFGDYELRAEIGRGGMGAIYKARQPGLNRIVAVKVILGGHFASRESIRRFQAEAQAAARLQHPNIVALYEVGEHEGQHFFSMEFVEGHSLEELIRDRPLPASRAARYVRIIAEAIHHAHERGVLHRDLKPSNILIDGQDQPRITDFGLAKSFVVPLSGGSGAHDSTPGPANAGTPYASLTLTGQVLGSPNYMPPEQAAGRSGEVGPWSDVYALGAILYQLLTGRCPFLADTVEQTLQQALHKEPVPPRALNPALPRDLETICLKCLEKDPQRRYRSAQELEAELARFLNHEPIRARPVSPLGRTWRWCRRRPAVASLLAAVAVLLVALVVGSTTAAIRIKRAERLATEKLRDSYLHQARARRASGLMGQRFESLTAISNAAAMNPPPELRFQLRNEAIACLALIDARLIEPRLQSPTPRVELISFSPNFDIYARLDERNRISVRRTADDTELTSLKLTAPYLWFFHGFSPDGQLLAIEYNPGESQVWDVRQGKIRFQSKTGDGYCGFSPDSRKLTARRPDGTVVVYDLETGKSLKEFHGASAHAYVRFDRSGKRLAWFNSRARAIEIYDFESGTRLQTIPQAEPATELSWNQDGRLLAGGCEDGRGVVWDTQTGGRRFTLEAHDSAMLRVSFNRSGRLIASSSWDETTRIWDSATGRSLLRLPGMSYQLLFSGDDRWLAFTRPDDRFYVIELISPLEFSTLPLSEKSGGPFEPAFSPDGRWLANACKLGVQLWEVASGNPVALIKEPTCRSVRFARDGSSLFTAGLGGLARWPIRFDPSGDPDVVQVGAREALPFSGAFMQVASSASGETLAVTDRDKSRALVFGLENLEQPTVLGPHPNVQSVAVSPDARWIATGPWQEREVKVWNAQSGKSVFQFRGGPNATVEFSADGQWLVTAGEEYRLWKTGSWEPGPTIALPRKNVPVGHAAFSHDSRTLAVVHAGRELRLLEVAGARPLAVFESPTQTALSSPRFSPDGTLLAALGPNGEVRVWNLQRIRRQLAAMQLDWADGP